MHELANYLGGVRLSPILPSWPCAAARDAAHYLEKASTLMQTPCPWLVHKFKGDKLEL